MSGITLLGLGPGDPNKMTREAWNLLSSPGEAWLRTREHPVVAGLPSTLKVFSFDDLYNEKRSFEEVYAAIVEKVIALGSRPQGVVYAVPGDPFIAEATCPEIAHQARTLGMDLHVVNGMSFLEPVFSAMGIDPFPRLALVDAMDIASRHVPHFPPDMPALIAQLYSPQLASEVKMTLNSTYPDEHSVCLVHAAGTENEALERICLYEIDRSRNIGALTALYVPAMEQGTSFEAFAEVVARLRAPDGCPWDREQTHSSLRPHMLEETYEVLTAIDAEDPQKMAEELGDLLLQIVLHAQIAGETGAFAMADVLKRINAKIIHRHPHVFGDLSVEGVKGVLQNWEKLKDEERQVQGGKEKGLLDGVPLSLPSLAQAQEYQDRAARVGFDWPEIEGVLDKIVEEINEVGQAGEGKELADELGDLFFALVNLARWKKVDAESVLREANVRFKSRFAYIEEKAKSLGKRLSDMSLDEMENLWQEAKKK